MSSARTAGPLLRALMLAVSAMAIAACDGQGAPPGPAPGPATGRTPRSGAPVPVFTCRSDGDRSERRRDAPESGEFADFLESLRRECPTQGKFLVEGDVAIGDLKLLREYFEDHVAAAAPRHAAPLAETPAPAWSGARRRALTYCVSTAFRGQHDKVVADMEAAAGAWEQVADVDFTHVAAQDAACDARADAVVFDVNPVDVGGAYLARAFAPGDARADRSVYIDIAALALDSAQPLQLSGVLRHALGHVLGFGHAAAPDGPCALDAPDIPAARDPAPDATSVMLEPRCAGPGRRLLLSDDDKIAAACRYGAASGYNVDASQCPARVAPVAMPAASLTTAPTTPVSRSFPARTLAHGAVDDLPVLDARPGSVVRISMTPHGALPGDPDLYVRLGQRPSLRPRAFTCRPFLTGALETCELDVGAPPNNLVHIQVHGFTAGSYDLEVSYVPLTPQARL